MEPTAQSLLGAYELGPRIGDGSFGVVGAAVFKGTGSPVAIKRAREGGEREVEQEASILQRLSGLPYMAGLREAFPGKAMFVAQMAPGQDLLTRLKESLLTFDEWLALTYQLLEFLKALHLTDHFHGDLKPDNLMFDGASNSLTVIDIGGAGKVGAPFQLCQAPPFRAPEVILRGPIDTKMDIWSSAVLLFFALTGEHLFPIVCPSLEGHKDIRDNQLLHMICDLIGMPPVDFFTLCKGRARELFQVINESITFKNPLRPINQEDWIHIQNEYYKYFASSKVFESWQQKAQHDPSIQEIMDKALKDMSEVYWKQEDIATRLKKSLKEDPEFSEEKITSIIAILSQMLTYPRERLPASRLIENSLFNQSMTHFKLSLPSGRHEITIFDQSGSMMTYKIDRIVRSYCFPGIENMFVAARLSSGEVLEAKPIQIESGDLLAFAKVSEGQLDVQVIKPSALKKPPMSDFLPTRLFFLETEAAQGEPLPKKARISLTEKPIDH